jgi:hypothetical protein
VEEGRRGEEKEESAWKKLVRQALVPWSPSNSAQRQDGDEEEEWRKSWCESIELLLAEEKVCFEMERLCWLTTDVGAILRVFVRSSFLSLALSAFLSLSLLLAVFRSSFD